MQVIKTYKAEEVWQILVEHAAQDLPQDISGTFKVRMLKDSSVEVLFEQDVKKEELN